MYNLISDLDIHDKWIINSKEDYENRPIVTGLYIIFLKNGKDCDIKYGRQYYDFSEGSLILMEPEQVSVFESKAKAYKNQGWMPCFHPYLIRKSSLVHKMGEFSFISVLNISSHN